MGLKLATLAYLRRDGRTLMLHRDGREEDYHRGRYNGLGGKFEPGESPEACLAREVREESGLVVEEARLKGVITFPLFDGADDWYTFVFVVPRFSGSARPSVEGSLHWVPDGDVADLPLWPGDRVFLPWLRHETFFSATFRYLDGVFQSYEAVFYGAGGAVVGEERGGPASGGS
ncbi:MAG TPA: 8-oxo-dGTP diphosphatase [Trueperaceae bacterium]|nr:8-oxo-dGTP diphosphatase [Trueperaceae bacterium]